MEQFQSIHATAHNLVFSEDRENESILDFMSDYNVAPELRLAFQLGKINYQVQNGGWMQYFDNGYADGDGGGFFNRHEGHLRAHREMMTLLSNAKEAIVGDDPNAQSLFETVYKIFNNFIVDLEIDDDDEIEETCEECDGSGYVVNEEMDDDDDDYEEERCDACDGPGHVMVDNEYYDEITESTRRRWDELSTQYYDVDDEWVALLDRYFSKVLNDRPEWVTEES